MCKPSTSKALTKRKQTSLNALMTPSATSPRLPDRAALPGPVPGAIALVAMIALSRLMIAAARSSWPTRAGEATAEDVLAGIVAWAGLGVCLWLVASLLLVTLSALPGTVGRWAARLARAVTPVLVRRALSLAVGASVGTLGLPAGAALGDAPPPGSTQVHSAEPGSTGPASRPTRVPPSSVSPAFRATARSGSETSAPRGSEVTTTPRPATAAEPGSTASPEPGWRPSRPVRAHDAETSQLLAPVPRTSTASIETVTVRRGDSLWSIAARHLGAGATDAEIAVAWPAWHTLNADLIGDDPDLIHPGLRLRVPTHGDHP
jgi:nucleoid-associated protein YgaU